MRLLTIRSVLAGCLLLGGCSLPQLAYNNADVALRFLVQDYVSPTPEQEALLDLSIQRLHRWHRREELPRYAGVLRDAAQKISVGLHAGDVQWSIDRVRERYRDFIGQAFDEALPALKTIREENIVAMERKFAERNAKYTDKFLSDDAAARREARTDAMVEHLQRWFGDLDEAQRLRVERFVASQPDYAAVSLAHRRHRQSQIAAQLRAIARGDAQAASTLRDILVNWPRHASVQYVQLLRDWDRELNALMLDLEFRPAQRAEAARKLRDYAQQLEKLSAEGTRT